MNEKKFTLIVVALALVAIVVVILVNLPWGGDKAAIDKEYESLDRDHVFESIDFDEFFRKIENNETFQIYIGSNKLNQVEYFVAAANKYAKEREIKTIYYLRSSELTTEQLDTIKQASSLEITLPTLMYWMSGETKSEAHHISSLEKIENYPNWDALVRVYFERCYD
ncbi:MAG: hypothetical protein GX661_05340 [Acholeplasmataceae bacterium]|nr:hypothetical protein [Acholeplasmataceae bacterium]